VTEVSYIVTSFNKRQVIGDCLRAILGQCGESSEVLVVDDASTDGTPTYLAREFPGVRLLVNESNRGAAYSRNRGLREADGEYLFFVDGDVVLEPGCSDLLLKAASPSTISFPTIDYDNGKRMYPFSEETRAFLALSTVFVVARSFLEEADVLFDEYYRIYFEDLDFFLQCHLRGAEFCYVPDASTTHAIEAMRESRLDAGAQRYYLEVRNSTYFVVKYLGLKRELPVRISPRELFPLFVFGLFNFDWIGEIQAFSEAGVVRKFTMLAGKRHPLARKGWLPLLFVRAHLDLARDAREVARRRREFHMAFGR